MRGGVGGSGDRGGPGATDTNAPLSILDVWRQEAAADMGLSPADLVFVPISGEMQAFGFPSAAFAGTGTRFYPTDGPGGLASSGGGAGGVAVISTAGALSGTIPLHVLAGASDRWWLKARMACNRAGSGGGPAGAGAVIGIAARSSLVSADTSHDLVAGIDGAVSTTNFVASGAVGSAINSGVAIDALFHDHKIWRNGASSFYQVDRGSPLSGNIRPGANSKAALMACDSAAVAQVIDWCFFACAFPLRALGAA